MTRPRVLLVDDDASVRGAVSSALAGEGYDVAWFGDAENALRQALVSPPAVVLLDVTMPRLDDGSRPTSIGVPVPGVEVQLVDEVGDESLVGDPGEIWVRGPNVFGGYWSDEQATRSALTEDGWLKTGDIAIVSDGGDLHIVDRAKDLIIVSGFNVYPVEVEAVLAEHPAVREVAVVGAAHPTTGETVEAFVVAEPGREPTPEELIAWCGGRLARYKCPTIITFVPELPHGLVGKLLRRRLRAERAEK